MLERPHSCRCFEMTEWDSMYPLCMLVSPSKPVVLSMSNLVLLACQSMMLMIIIIVVVVVVAMFD